MKIEVTKCNWTPATDDEVGELSFEANTPKGVFKWHEELPRTGESEESCEKNAWMNGVPVKLEEVEEYPEFSFPCNPSEKKKKRIQDTLAQEIEEALNEWAYYVSEIDLPTCAA